MDIGNDDSAANAEKVFFSDNATSFQRIKHWPKYCTEISVTFSSVTISEFNVSFLGLPVSQLAGMSRAFDFIFNFPGIPLLLFVSEKIAKQKRAAVFSSFKENLNTL